MFIAKVLGISGFMRVAVAVFKKINNNKIMINNFSFNTVSTFPRNIHVWVLCHNLVSRYWWPYRGTKVWAKNHGFLCVNS